MPLTVAMLREIDAEMEFRECPQCVTCGQEFLIVGGLPEGAVFECDYCVKTREYDMFTKKEQKQFEDIFEAVLSEKSDVARLRSLGDVIFEMTGNVNLRILPVRF